MGTGLALGLVFGVAVYNFALGIGIGALIGRGVGHSALKRSPFIGFRV
jgi:Ca2+/Na+ antiporter